MPITKILSLFILSIVVASCQKKTETTETPVLGSLIRLTDDQFRYIKMDSVKLVNDMNELTLNGKVSFDQNQVVKVFPVAGGMVSRVLVNVGDLVHKGDPLAVITGGDVSTVAGDYAVAKANLELARKAMDAAQQLYNTNVYSERDLLNAQNDFKKAQAEFEKSQSYAGMMGLTGEKSEKVYTVSAPADGYVVEKNVSENTVIRPDNSNNLFTISALKDVWVIADLYENDLARVKKGDGVSITTIAYPDKVFTGKIDQIGNFLDPVSRVAKVKIVLDNSEGLLKPEMYASVKVYSMTSKKVLAIPTIALVLEGDHYTTMLWKNDHQFEKRRVDVLRTIGNQTLIKGGLQEGERVVTEGSLLVSNNNAALMNQ